METFVGELNRSSHSSESPCPTISGYHWHLKKVNGVNAVFLQERYGIDHYLSVKGDDCNLKPCYSGVRFEDDNFRS